MEAKSMAKETKGLKGPKGQGRGASTRVVGPASDMDKLERPVLEIVSMVPGDGSLMTDAEIHAMVLHDMDKEAEHELDLKAGERLMQARFNADLAQGLARLEDRYMRELRIRSGEQIALLHFGQHHVMTAEVAPEGVRGIELSDADLERMGISHGDVIIVRRLGE
jgi:hypothetical protein